MLAQQLGNLDEELARRILDFSEHVAGECEIKAACVSSDHAFGLPSVGKMPLEVLVIIRDYQPRLMNYVKVINDCPVIFVVVDQWVFEKDVERAFLGEALAGELAYPYIPLLNGEYLHLQEVISKRRLVLELLENIVLDFPELSYEIHIKPEYFVYETLLRRARLFPPLIHSLCSLMRKDSKKANVESILHGYQEALEILEKESTISFLNGFVKISREFVDKTRNLQVRFVSSFKIAQKTLFTTMLGVFPKVVTFFSRNRKRLLKLPRFNEMTSNAIRGIEDPQKYLYVPTANGLVPLTSRVDIEGFARCVLAADENAEIKIKQIGGVLNDTYSITASVDGEERKVVVKRFKDWSSFKWFPLTLWTLGTKTFAVLGRSRLERECAINQFLYSKGFNVPKLLYVNHAERLVFMDYVEGENLEKTIQRILNTQNVKVENELDVISRIGEKFAEIHALGVSLGDAKPENIIVGKEGTIYLMDFEQASRNGDQVWDIAEFLYYAGHYVAPLSSSNSIELLSNAFIRGYLRASGKMENVKKAAKPKYTKVFSVFTQPHVMLAISNICRKAETLKE